jgi:uncharacterized damage-inducible protein DinB
MKEIIHLYSAYDHWANTRIVGRLQRESDAVLDRPVKSSFASLRLTVLHLRNAGSIWQKRIFSGAAPMAGAWTDDVSTLLDQSAAMNDLVLGSDEQRLLEPVAYADLKGDPFTQPRWQLLMHVFNHATYHRGQLVSIMHQLELGEIPGTDLVAYQRLLTADV